MAQQEYQTGKRPLQQSNNTLELYGFVNFAQEFAEENSKLKVTNPLYGQYFQDNYKNARMISFDSNFGDSLDQEVELFAIKMWKPINSVKLFAYNFDLQTLTELYEIPIKEEHLDQLANIQLVRISDFEVIYALLLDWCSVKEIYLIKFTDASPFSDNRDS